MKKLLFIAVLCAAGCLAQSFPVYTQITDTLFTPVSGVPFNGRLQISNPVMIGTPAMSIGQWAYEFQIVNGAVSVALIPNDTASPAGTTYVFHFTAMNFGPSWTQYCTVPSSMSPVKLNSICSLTAVPSQVAIGLGQITQSGATPGQFVEWNGGAWVPAAVSGGGAWGSITGSLSSQTDLQTALNAKQASLGFTPENVANKDTASGYAGLAGGLLKVATECPAATSSALGCLTAADWTTFNGKQTALGFTPENIANKDTASGYAGLTAGGLLKVSTECPAATASVFGCLAAADWTTFNGKQAALGFTPENIANKDAASGYPGLTAGGLLKVSTECPAATASVFGCLAAADWITFNGKQAALGFTPLNPANNLSEVTPATARTNLGLGSAATAASSAFDTAGAAATAQTTAQASSLQKASNLSDLASAATARTNLGAESTANKDAASGYAGLTAGGLLNPSEFPFPAAGALGGVKSQDCSAAGGIQKIGTDGSITCGTAGAVTQLSVAVTIPNAQVLTLHSVGVTLVPAAGAGSYLEFVSMTLENVFVTAAYTGGGAIGVDYTGPGGTAASATVAATFLTTPTANQFTLLAPTGFGILGLSSTFLNKPLALQCATADYATGGGSLIVHLVYRLHTGF